MATGNLSNFISLLETEVKNHSIYVWGGQGETGSVITKAWIKSKENSKNNAERAIAFWTKQKNAGYGKVLKAFDCSGLGIWALQKLNIVKKDMNANTLKQKCTKLSKSQLKKGDWVFRIYTSGDKKGKAYHIGYIVDNTLSVIESYGRDRGVIKRNINAEGTNYWNWFGRPSYFKSEIDSGKLAPPVPQNPNNGNYVFSRTLRSGSHGDDVKNLQILLNATGIKVKTIKINLIADGCFGSKTKEAVREFQKLKKLKVDGIAGKNTIVALSGKWI